MRRDYPLQPIIGVGAVILDCGRLVLVKRGAEPALGKWSFPGGAVELGEAVRNAVIRETKEECGLDVEFIEDTPIDAYDILTLDKTGRIRYHYVLLQFIVRPKQGKLESISDVTDARWVPFEEVETYDLAESVRSFFIKHRKELQKH